MNENTASVNWRRANGSGRARLIGPLIAAVVMILLAVGHAGAAVHSKPPTPYFVSPLNGSTVEGTVPVIVFAPELAQFDAELGVDGEQWQPMHSRGDGIFELKWNSADVSSGKHTLTARFTFGPTRPPIYGISIRVNVLNPEIPLPPDS